MKRFLALLLALTLWTSAACAMSLGDILSTQGEAKRMAELIAIAPEKTWTGEIQAGNRTLSGVFNSYVFPTRDSLYATVDAITGNFTGAGYAEEDVGDPNTYARLYTRGEDFALFLLDLQSLALYTLEPQQAAPADTLFGLDLQMDFPDVQALWGCAPEGESRLFTVGVSGIPYTGHLLSFYFADEAAARRAAGQLDSVLTAQYAAQRAAFSDPDTQQPNLLFSWGEAFCLMQQIGARVYLVLQDGRYAGVEASPVNQPGAAFPDSNAYFDGAQPLGRRAVCAGDWTLVGSAWQYAVPQDADGQRRLNQLYNDLGSFCEAQQIEVLSDTLSGLYALIFVRDGAPIAAFMTPSDAPDTSYVMLYQDAAQLQLQAVSSPAPTSAPTAAQPAATAAPVAEAAVYLDGSPAQAGTAILYQTDTQALGVIYALAFSASDGAATYAVCALLAPADYHQGAAFSIDELRGVDTLPALVISAAADGQEELYTAGENPENFGQGCIQILRAPAAQQGHEIMAELQFYARGQWHTLQGVWQGEAQTVQLDFAQPEADPLQGSGICAMCAGSGRCHLCGGKGQTYTFVSSVGDSGWLACSACYGKGACPWCQGAGSGGIYAQ